MALTRLPEVQGAEPIIPLENRQVTAEPTPQQPLHQLNEVETIQILGVLETRFKSPDGLKLHEGLDWGRVKDALDRNPEVLWSVNQMEAEGHEPDVYDFDETGFDIGTCRRTAPPKSTRNCTYQQAVTMAAAMGVQLMTEYKYEFVLQTKDKFDHASGDWGVLWSMLLTDEAQIKAGNIRVGTRYASGVSVANCPSFNKSEDMGWRGSKRVNWATLG